MSLNFDECYRLSKNIEIEEKDGQFLYIDYESTNWLRTDEIGSDIIKKCDGSQTLSAILNEKANNDGFNYDTLASILSPFLEKCIQKGIIVEKNSDIDKEDNLFTELNYLFPKDIWIHVSERCNLKCPFCYSNSSSDVCRSLEMNKVINFLSGIPQENRNSIIISGGEPFMYPDLPELVDKIKNELKFRFISVITNGTVGEDVYLNVIPNIDILQISLDGTTAEVHDITRGTGSFDKVCKKFVLAKELKVKKLVCSFTPTKYNIHDLPNLPLFAYNNNIDALHITRLMPTGRGQRNKDVLYPDLKVYNDSINGFIENIRDVNRKIYMQRSTNDFFESEDQKRKYIGVTFASDQTEKVVEGGRRLNCGLANIISIGYDSKIYPCPSLSAEEFELGGLDNTIDEIMVNANKFANKYSVNCINEECKTCKYKYFCGGGCRACTYGLGDIAGEDPSCSFYKQCIENALWNYNITDYIE